jgi:hypothetical protein
MNTRIIRTVWLLALLFLNIGITARSEGENLSKSIVGRWQALDAQPPRFPKFLANGTWQLVYWGRSDMQTGKWRIEGRRLIRTYENGEERYSEILKLNSTEMVLRTQMINPSTGQLVKQTDHYKRLNDRTVRVPAANVKVIRQ